jgi:Tfp pilus assembly protein PilO
MNLNKAGKIKFLKNANQKQKIIYLHIFSLSAAALLIYFIFMPAMDDIRHLKAQIIDQKMELENKLVRDKTSATLGMKIKKIEPDLGRLDRIYIDENKKLEFITRLEGLAKASQVDQTINLDYGDSADKGQYRVIPITIDKSGNYENLLAYLVALEELEIYITPGRVRLSKSGNRQAGRGDLAAPDRPLSGREFTMQISAATYWK